MRYWFLLLMPFLIASCRSGNSGDALFETVSADESHLDFTNTVTDDKDFNIFNYRNFYNGGGVAIGDVNGDGRPDVFLIANMGDNKLFLNKTEKGSSKLEFQDVTKQAGVAGKRSWSTGATFADVNGDGRLDLYVCNAGIREGDDRGNELFINMGNGPDGTPTFQEKAQAYGLDDHGYSTHAAFFDYDRDGDLDMYLLNNSFLPVGRLQYANLRAERDSLGGQKLFRNMSVERGDDNVARSAKENTPVFTDVSEAESIYGSLIGFGLGITIGDVNSDGWLDIYISNDFYERDYLYLNQHDAAGQHTGFKEVIKESMPHTSLSSMGADIADVDNDGRLDIFVTDMLPGNDSRLKRVSSYETYDLQQIKLQRDFHYQIMQNMLHLNRGDLVGDGLPRFSEVARFAGVHATDWSWGALIFDMDGDGQKDIFVANGIAKDVTDQDFVNFLSDRENMAQIARQQSFNFKEFLDKAPAERIPNYAFRNKGGLQFENVAETWGLAEPNFSNGAAYGDLDGDGDLDLIVNNVNAPVSLYRNQTQEQKKTAFLRVNLEGKGLNRNAIGATVRVYQPGRTQTLQQMPNRGFQSSVDLGLVFGLGESARIDSVTVVWPDDQQQTLRSPKANQTITLRWADARSGAPVSRWRPSQQRSALPLRELTATSGLTYRHQESNFVDYNRDPLLKQMLSTGGPALAVGDVNGDGLDDVFLGGSSGQSGRLFRQQNGGRYVNATSPAIQRDSTVEATDAVFFDADGDKDLDLYVVTGSNEFQPEAEELRDLFYRNDGRGNFTPDGNLPNLKYNGSCVAAADYDQDGDVDLFVGSRMVPGQYGRSPISYLLTNDGTGTFKNYTKRSLPDAEQLGMVTGATWADLNGDRYPELILTEDWGPVRVFKNSRGRLTADASMAIVDDNGQPLRSEGWWNCVKAADVDGDGDLDVVAGNLGLNSRIRATPDVPAELYVNDFDNNGVTEQIINCADETGKLYPMVLKNELQKAMPTIKKRYVKFTDYAGKTIDQIVDENALQRAVKRSVYTGQSAILLNDGRGKLTFMPLPTDAQLSPICAVGVADVDADGKLDVLLAGNFFDVLPEIGRYDAGYGLVLRGLGKGKGGKPQFDTWLPDRSGFFAPGQVRRMAQTAQGQFILANNNTPVQVFGRSVGTVKK